MAEIIWTKRATRQLERAVRYIEEEQGTGYARTVLDRILHDVGLLEDSPTIGFREPLLEHRKFEYRSLVVWSYKVIYRLQKHRVIISRGLPHLAESRQAQGSVMPAIPKGRHVISYRL